MIHRGKKIYDGGLDRLEAGAGSRQKIITFLPSVAEAAGPAAAAGFPDAWQSSYGSTVRGDDGKFRLRVPATDIAAVSQEILSTGPVADITIEDVPLEDVIAELFTNPAGAPSAPA